MALVKKTKTPTEIVAAAAAVQDVSDRKQRIRSFAEDVSAAENNLGWMYIRLGVELHAAKAEVGHSHFLEWLAEDVFPEWAETDSGKQGRPFHDSASYKRAARAMLVAEHALTAAGIEITRVAEIADGMRAKVKTDAAAEFEAKTTAATAGKPIRQLLLPWTVEADATGGFRPPEAAVQQWLARQEPEHAGTTYADLPAEVQEKFRATWRPKPPKIDRVLEAESLTKAFTRQADQYQRTKAWKLIGDDMLRSLSLQLVDLHTMVRQVLDTREAKAAKAKTPKKLK